ncbi:JAB domain-containing protein [Algoriphagus aestuariicola]|uniref:JAB domain-containing protein n=1 Tax=Algoriphagus aestuariicola TaxID=1852016 RepID=A0ABS3BLM0_9BACT|nr:JAB domain-containing protein [Algoriphagus aestuariicola]MBN7799230.1 JAB domain-containing protein [Algoriphagus aestuariicola]
MKNFLYELKLSYHRTSKKPVHGAIKTSRDCFEILNRVFDHDLIEAREEFVILYLNRSNQVIGYYKAFQGGVASVVCDPKMILSMALKTLASSIVLAHNHPSGKLAPSDQDIRLTERVKQACRYVDVELLDHLILTARNGYFSFADDGKL